MSAFPTLIDNDIAEYIVGNFSSEDEFLAKLKKDAEAEDIPQICISPEQGRFMQFFLRAMNAKYVLEVGSLFGYSAINMARALPEGGKVITLEIEPKNARFIRKKAIDAGLEDKIEVHNVEANTFLGSWKPDVEFDFVFVDADKKAYKDYLDKTSSMIRKGGVFAADNALAFGNIVNPDPDRDISSIQAIRDFNDYFRAREDYYVTLLAVGDGMIMGIRK